METVSGAAGALLHPNAGVVGEAMVAFELVDVCLEWLFRLNNSEIENSDGGADESQLKILPDVAPPIRRPSTTRPAIESSSIHRRTITMPSPRSVDVPQLMRT